MGFTNWVAINIARQLPLLANQPGCGWYISFSPAFPTPSPSLSLSLSLSFIHPYHILHSTSHHQLSFPFGLFSRCGSVTTLIPTQKSKAPGVNLHIRSFTHARMHPHLHATSALACHSIATQTRIYVGILVYCITGRNNTAGLGTRQSH